MQHFATDLTAQQLQAIDLFASGQSLRCIAETVGVTRETLWRWRQQELFVNALHHTRQKHYDHMRIQAEELVRLAMVAITRELKKAEDPKLSNPLDTAFRVLQFVSSHGLSREMAPTPPAMLPSSAYNHSLPTASPTR